MSDESTTSKQPASPPAASGQKPATEAPPVLGDLGATLSCEPKTQEQQQHAFKQATGVDCSGHTFATFAAEIGAESRIEADIAAYAAQAEVLPTIPGFELNHEIARGGMGVVYQARDLTLNRIVAIKVLRECYSPDSPIASRFFEEAQITGQLQHPGIPPIYQMGTLADGRPYLAMKLIKGETLEAIIKKGQPGSVSPESPRLNYLALIEAIAQAVGYAHAHGVIHRDLKPQNIMVGRFGEVQVMDWGLAKVVTDTAKSTSEQPRKFVPQTTIIRSPRLSDSGSETEVGSVVGTWAYMAPEQAAGENDRVGPRSDVFGLGAVLCSMLTGQPPYTGNTGVDLQVQVIHGQTADAFARLDACGAEPGLISLCKRCLAFAPEDRPADGNAVAAEVAALRQEAEERAKQAELEQARAEVMAAEQRKRRRVVQWSAAAVAAVLLIGLCLSLWQMTRAIAAERQAAAERDAKEWERQRTAAERDEKERQRQRAEANEKLAAERLVQVEAEKKRAEEERKIATAVSDFLQYKLLGQLDPLRQADSMFQEIEPDPRLSVLVARAAAELAPDKIETSFPKQPLLQAALLHTVGQTYAAIGGKDNDRYAMAISFLERSAKLRELFLGADHRDTLVTLTNLAHVCRLAGQLPEAIRLLEQVRSAYERKLGADHPDTLAMLNHLSRAYQDAGRLPEAIRLFEQVRSVQEHKLGTDHPDTLATLSNLAGAYQDAGRLPEAIRLVEQVRAAQEHKLGADHPKTLTTLNNLALAYQAAGLLPEAIRLFEQVRINQEKKLGTDHPYTLTTTNNLAGAYLAAGRLPEAIRLFEQLRTTQEHRLGKDHPYTLRTINNLALAYHAAGRLPEAINLYERVRTAFEQKLGADHPHTLISLANLARGYQAAGRLPEALPLFEQAAQGIANRQFQHEHALGIITVTIRAYEEAKQLEKAETWRRRWLAVVKERAGADSPAYAGDLAALGLNLLMQQKWAEAETILRECLTIREKTLGVNSAGSDWLVFNTKSMLGGALVGRAGSVSDGSEKAKLLAEAEPLLLQGYEGILSRLVSEDPKNAALLKTQKQRLAEAADRLIKLYTALDKPDEVKKWQAEKEKWR